MSARTTARITAARGLRIFLSPWDERCDRYDSRSLIGWMQIRGACPFKT
jgi:hypothetical protein